MTPDDLNAMAKRWETDLAQLPLSMSFARESLSKAIADLIEAAEDETDELDSARSRAA